MRPKRRLVRGSNGVASRWLVATVTGQSGGPSMQARVAIITSFVVGSLCVHGSVHAQGPIRTSASLMPVAAGISSGPARAQNPPAAATQAPSSADDLTVSVYPVLIWVPRFSAETNVPPFPDVPDGPELPGGSGKTKGSFDGAALAGVSIEKGKWRLDTDGIWAGVGAERESPRLSVDADVIYGHASGGWKIYKDLYLTAGIRRVAIDYDIRIGDRPSFDRKPGLWDPLVGLGYHSNPDRRVRWHIIGEGGGFGVGADLDLAGSVRADFRFTRHFGMTGGYSLLYLELSDTRLGRTLEVKQTMHGPTLGIGFYF